jgi:hypothetical protein
LASQNDANSFSRSFEFHMERVRRGGYAYFSLYSTLRQEQDCTMAVVKIENINDNAHMGLQLNSALTPAVNDL